MLSDRATTNERNTIVGRASRISDASNVLDRCSAAAFRFATSLGRTPLVSGGRCPVRAPSGQRQYFSRWQVQLSPGNLLEMVHRPISHMRLQGPVPQRVQSATVAILRVICMEVDGPGTSDDHSTLYRIAACQKFKCHGLPTFGGHSDCPLRVDERCENGLPETRQP